MGRYGQAILTIGGALIGSLVGFPALGTVIGSLAGSLLFPQTGPKVDAPRLSDAGQTSATVGTPLPRGWGTWASTGIVIAQTDLREVVTEEEVGGKGGGGQSQETVTYFQDFAIAFNGSDLYGKGEIAGVLAIFANGKPIYDLRPKLPEETEEDFEARMIANHQLETIMTIYRGTEDQEPDPTLEAFFGVGKISAFRGVSYAAFANWQNRAEDGNRMPQQWKFIVYTDGVAEVTDQTEYANEVLYDWHTLGNDPTNSNNKHKVLTGTFEGTTLDVVDGMTIVEAVASLNGDIPKPWPETVFLGAINHVDGSDLQPNCTGGTGFSDQSGSVADLIYGPVLPERFVQIDDAAGLDQCVPSSANPFAQPGVTSFGTAAGGTAITLGIPGTHDVPVPMPPFDFWTNVGRCDVEGIFWYQSVGPMYITVQRLPSAPIDPCQGRRVLGDIAAGYCITDDEDFARSDPWELDESRDFLVLQTFSGDIPVRKPLSPALPVGDERNTEAFWTAAYNAAVARNEMNAGMTYDAEGDGDPVTTFPHVQSFAYLRTLSRTTVTTNPVSQETIVSDLMEEAGYDPADFDARELREIMEIGVSRKRVMAPRSMLEQLRMVGFWDMAPIGTVLKFIRRGGPIVRVLEESDLGAHGETEEPPSAITTTRRQEMELPRRVRIHYSDPTRDYEPGEQASQPRVDTKAQNDIDVEIDMVLSADRAAQVAEVVHNDAWSGRHTHTIQLSSQHSDLTPTDPLGVPLDGRVERMRLETIEDQLPGLRKCELVRDDDGAYVSTAVGSTQPYLPQPVSLLVPVQLLLLDLPSLREDDNDAGVYAAIRPYLGSQSRPAAIYRSADQGGTYLRLGSVPGAGVIGKVVSPLGAGPSTIWDDASELLVDMKSGTPENRTEAAVLAGANAAAVGLNGRFEIIQFTTREHVAENIWRISGFLRGRRGTEQFIGTGQVGDRFVVLSNAGSNVVRLPMPNTDIGQEMLYKAIPSGISLNSIDDQAFTTHGVALKPFSPAHLLADRQDNGDLVLTWVRRSRFGSELHGGPDLVLGEATEAYEIDIRDDAGAVKRTLTASLPTITWTLAQQEIDLGFQETGTIAVYQMSAVVGRGTPEVLAVLTSGTSAPPIDYPQILLQIEFGGSPGGTEDVYVRIQLNTLAGGQEVFETTLLGASNATPADYANDLATQLDGYFTGAPVAVTVESVTVTQLAVDSGNWFAVLALPIHPTYAFTTLREPLPAQTAIFQAVDLDLYEVLGGFWVNAPDQNVRYRLGGHATVLMTINGMTWEKQEELNYGMDRQIDWAVIQDLSDQKHVSMADAIDELRGTAFSKYIRTVGYNVIGGKTVINVSMQQGYFLSETYLLASGTGSHPSGYKPGWHESVEGRPSYPNGAKKMVSAYWTPDYNAGPAVAYFTAGMALQITLNGTLSDYTLDSDEADAFNDPGGVGIDPTFVTARNAVLDDLESQIETGGNFVVRKELQSNGLYQNWRIERTVADTGFTITMGVSGYDLTVATTLIES